MAGAAREQPVENGLTFHPLEYRVPLGLRPHGPGHVVFTIRLSLRSRSGRVESQNLSFRFHEIRETQGHK